MADEVTLAPAAGLRVVWELGTLGDDGRWTLDGSLDPGFEALRVISGRAEDGSALVLSAARPVGAASHEEESVAAVAIDPEGTVHEISEAMLSTEYAADGSIRRLGLELYKPEGEYPIRAAGDTREAASSEADGERRRRAVLDFRLDGSVGSAIYEIVERI